MREVEFNCLRDNLEHMHMCELLCKSLIALLHVELFFEKFHAYCYLLCCEGNGQLS